MGARYGAWLTWKHLQMHCRRKWPACAKCWATTARSARPGAIGAAFIELDLRAADKAVMSGDVVAMIQSLETLRGIKG